jgi:hypothetical protein
MIEALDLHQVLFHLFCQWLLALQLFLFIVKPRLTLALVVLVATFAPIAWASMVFLGDLVLVSPLEHGGPASSMHSTIFIKP